MKRLLIGDKQEKLLATLEVILKHWGYRVLVTSRPEQVTAFIRESAPGLLILGSHFLAQGGRDMQEAVRDHIGGTKAPLILLGAEEITLGVPHETLALPLDVFPLFALIQRHLERYPRQHLRLNLQLPGMLCLEGMSQLSEVMSLSTRGLFLRTGFRLEKGEQLKVIFPLMGMKRELELAGRVLYRVHPDPENNYLQGLGIEFSELEDSDRHSLEAFIENRFFGELTDRDRILPVVEGEHLRNRNGITLRVI